MSVALFTGKHEPSLWRVGCHWWLSWADLEVQMCHDILHLLPSVVGVLDTGVGLGQGEQQGRVQGPTPGHVINLCIHFLQAVHLQHHRLVTTMLPLL